MTPLATADLHDLLAQALADAATETRRMGDVPDGHWDDKARALVARLHPTGDDLGAPIYETTAMRHGLAPNTRPLGGVRIPGLTAAQSVPLVVSPGSTMTRPDVPLRTVPETWGA